jgi:hypothetical protein
LPQQLGRLEESARWAAEARARAEQASRQADATPPDRQSAARHAASVAQANADEAGEWLEQVGQEVDSERVWKVTSELRAYAPETAPAVAPLERRLTPALMWLRLSIEKRDADGARRAAGEARRAIAAVQDGLRDARQALLDRDPLVAARWFAEQAASALVGERLSHVKESGESDDAEPDAQAGDGGAPSSESTSSATAPLRPATRPPSVAHTATTRPQRMHTAQQQQAAAVAALGRAWDDSIHRAAAARLSGLASMASILKTYAFDASGAGAEGMPRSDTDPSSRQWGRLRAWHADDLSLTAAAREPDPPGYQDALKAYFQVLGESNREE